MTKSKSSEAVNPRAGALRRTFLGNELVTKTLPRKGAFRRVELGDEPIKPIPAEPAATEDRKE